MASAARAPRFRPAAVMARHRRRAALAPLRPRDVRSATARGRAGVGGGRRLVNRRRCRSRLPQRREPGFRVRWRHVERRFGDAARKAGAGEGGEGLAARFRRERSGAKGPVRRRRQKARAESNSASSPSGSAASAVPRATPLAARCAAMARRERPLRDRRRTRAAAKAASSTAPLLTSLRATAAAWRLASAARAAIASGVRLPTRSGAPSDRPGVPAPGAGRSRLRRSVRGGSARPRAAGLRWEAGRGAAGQGRGGGRRFLASVPLAACRVLIGHAGNLACWTGGNEPGSPCRTRRARR